MQVGQRSDHSRSLEVYYRLVEKTELDDVLSNLGFTEVGKLHMLQELSSAKLLEKQGDVVLGCYLSTDCPGHLCNIIESLKIRQKLRKARLAAQSLAMSTLRAKRKLPKLYNGSEVDHGQLVEDRQDMDHTSKEVQKQIFLAPNTNKVYKSGQFYEDAISSPMHPEEEGFFDSFDEDPGDSTERVPIRKDGLVPKGNHDPPIPVDRSDRSKRSCLIVGMAWQVNDDLTLAEILSEAKTKNQSDVRRHRDAARMMKTLEFGFDNVFCLDRKPSKSHRHFCMDVSAFERSDDLQRLRRRSYSEISLDYLSDIVLGPAFYSTTLPFFYEILTESGRIYVPATPTIFQRIAKNWKNLSRLFLLRYIREDQVEESTLYRATLSVPMMDLGKQTADKQVLQFGLTYQEASRVSGASHELLCHHPKSPLKIRFLCLMRLRGEVRIERFEPFSTAYLQRTETKRKTTRQVAALAKESLDYLSRSTLKIKSIRPLQIAKIGEVKSPFHSQFLGGTYGLDRVSKTKKTKQVLSIPRFNPESVGLLDLEKGSWACIKCTAVHDSRRALHVCDSCSSLPSRSAKVEAPPFLTSRYVDHSDDSDYDENASNDDEDSDLEDEGFCLSDERQVTKNREISEYGRVWTSRDTHIVNEQLYSALSSLDPRPVADDPSSMWSTVIAFPASEKVNRSVINKQFHLGKRKQLEVILSSTVVAVKKNQAQVVGAFRLDTCPHAVMGNKAAKSFSDSFGAKLILFDNNVDHSFDPANPERPIVCNTDRVMGLSDRELIRAVGLPLSIVGLSLKQQVKDCITNGLKLHGGEYVAISQFDTRGTMSFHAGVSPREGAEWSRKNGCGIAVPGLRKNSLRASSSFRKWLLHLEILISHCFLEKFLTGTEKEQQAIPNQYRIQLLEDWRDYLGCPAEYAKTLRIGGGLSLNSGPVCFHLDHLNDPRELFDQISWGSVCVKNWDMYLTKTSLNVMKKFKVPLENTMFTALMYGRAIIGSQSDRLEGVVDHTCSFFQCCVSMIEDESYTTDFNTLEDAKSCTTMRLLLSNSAMDGLSTKYQYRGRYALIHECNNRFAFMGAFAWVWFAFLDTYRSAIKTRHAYEYLSFVMRECNGAPLMMEVMVSITEKHCRTVVCTMLKAPSPAFYIYLSKTMRGTYGRESASISSQTPRWQNLDHPVWRSAADNEAACIHVDFVTSLLRIIGRSEKEGERANARLLLCSGTARKMDGRWTEGQLDVLKLGAVRGTFGIQLSAFLLLTPPINSTHATIEKGTSGYYKCVNFHLKNKYNGKNLTTAQAQKEVSDCLQALKRSGFPVTQAWMDQNCCYWSRKYGRDDGMDGRKKDVFFFDQNRQLFPPIRMKVFATGIVKAQLFVLDSWYNLEEYWRPSYETNDLETSVKRQIDGKGSVTTRAWVKSIGREGSLSSYRRNKCRLKDGLHNLF